MDVTRELYVNEVRTVSIRMTVFGFNRKQFLLYLFIFNTFLFNFFASDDENNTFCA